MSELIQIVEDVKSITDDLYQMSKNLSVWSRQLAQQTSDIVDQLQGSSRTDIKNCLIALREATISIRNMQEEISQSISAANRWIQRNAGSLSVSTHNNSEFELGNSGLENETANTLLDREEHPGDRNENISGNKCLTPDEVNAGWKSVLNSVDSILENYRNALMNQGIPDNKLLDRFLQLQRKKMLTYESARLEEASGHGTVSEEDKYIYKTVGGNDQYGFESLANEYGEYCLDEASKWIQDINPNYYSPYILPENNPYRTNCGSCAFAVDTRLSGGDDLTATFKGIYTDREMELATGKRCVYLPIKGIEQYLRNQGPGSHLIVGINRGPAPNGSQQAGHWFNVYYDGVNFHTIDGQVGKIMEWPYDYGCITEWCALI